MTGDFTGQDRYLARAMSVRKRYPIYSETWEHDHCEFCGQRS